MKTQITIFVNPSHLFTALEILKQMEWMSIEQPLRLAFDKFEYSEAMISSYIWLTIDIEIYLKLKIYHQYYLTNEN